LNIINKEKPKKYYIFQESKSSHCHLTIFNHQNRPIMKETVLKQTDQRRGFLRGLGTGAAALGLAALTSAFKFTSQKEEAPTTG